LEYGFVIFWQKNIGAKLAHKILVKLTPKLLSFYLSTIPLKIFPNTEKVDTLISDG